jgi:hypothetical protein
MSSRPPGITLLSILLLLNSAAYAALAVLSIANMHALAALLQALSPSGAGPADAQLAMGRFVTIYYAALLLITGTLGMGFWKLWNWTRLIALAMIGVSLVAAAAETFSFFRGSSSAASAVFLVRVAVSVLIGVLIGWYLLSGKVRAAFRPAHSQDALRL